MLFGFQKQVLADTENFNRVAYYLDMGLGKTFVGSEKLKSFNNRVNLVICQKSKIKDWMNHLKVHCADFQIYDLTKKSAYEVFCNCVLPKRIGVINYDLTFRRPELLTLKDLTLMLDESSMIQNDKAKRTKFTLKLKAKNVILLSGTPTSGKYENLYSQIRLLGWNIPKWIYYQHYIETQPREVAEGVIINEVIGYKNVDRLKRKLAENGAVFLKGEDVKLELPEVNEIFTEIEVTKFYKDFMKKSIVEFNGIELVGDTALTKLLYARQLCSQYNQFKLEAFKDLIQSSNDRFIVFYQFTEELNKMLDICEELNKPTSVINGNFKDLTNYENEENSITFIQYQAGSMGLNLQKANKTIYFTLPLSSELFEQSKARTRRIGQEKPCFYYYLICKESVEEKILATLRMRKDYTDALFKKEFN